MELDLSAMELRVLGSLIEKALSTPDNYPLSTNALRSACNQKTSRDPVMDLAESDIDSTVLLLRERGLARSLRPSGSRSWKHRHVIEEALPIHGGQIALLAVLMLRGPQTSGELRTRTERMHGFDSVEKVEMSLESLTRLDQPLVVNLGRGPGQSQDRWVHLLNQDDEDATPASSPAAAAPARSEPVVTSRANPGRQEVFRRMHQAEGIFVMPNPWDRGSARILQEAGFPALATTSAGHGRAIGKDDQEVTRGELVTHVADLTEILTVPLNIDSERLFPDEPGGIAETVRLLANAGAAGCSIEDYNPATGQIDDIEVATAAVEVAVAACAEHGLVLTARAENYLYGVSDLDDTIARLRRYSRAGAECVYAPGLKDLEEIQRVVDVVGTPLNVLLYPDGPSVGQLDAVGVRRISLGSALFNGAFGALRTATDQLRRLGTTAHLDI